MSKQSLYTEMCNTLKQDISTAINYKEEWLKKAGMFDEIDDFIYEDMNQMGNELDDNEAMQAYQTKAKLIANKLYAIESNWNPRLPRTMTKVLGHDYTITEWLTNRLDMVADYCELITKY